MAKKKTTKKKTSKKKAGKKKALKAEVPAEEAKATGKRKKPATKKKAKAAPAAALTRPITLTYDQIAARAFLVWERKGKPDGQDAANWKEAEAELLAEAGVK